MNGRAEIDSSTAVFLVPGQGADPRGALAQLHRAASGVRSEIDGVLAEIEGASGAAGRGLRDYLLTETGDSTPGPGLPQIANYAISVVLNNVLGTVGVRPRAVVGQSFGEIAALVCAGVFDTADGARAVCALNAAFRDFEGRGAMVLVNASVRDTRELLDEVGHPKLVVACVNTPEQTIVSGPTDAIAALLSAPTERRLLASRFRTPHTTPISVSSPNAFSRAFAGYGSIRCGYRCIPRCGGVPTPMRTTCTWHWPTA
ncbi:acyltransferase domain-containing protein [Nocardia sp. N2S4-5]|uniref:acyltransferase domain-containing protein n=1 Tax=Nocardia sp. N2S4-5 TaxID=3351565 RepID=UPI0037CF5C11